MQPFVPCIVKALPSSLSMAAAKSAIAHNPANAPTGTAGLHPQHIALLTQKFWGAKGVKLGVYFLDTKDTSLKTRILSNMNAWGEWANVEFKEASINLAQVRLARDPGQGYYSYIGTDILFVQGQTMNLDSFNLQTPEIEYRRVVRHETGHTLGFIHEHLRRAIISLLDRAKTIAVFERDQGWSEQEVVAQVLTPAEENALTATPLADTKSVMCYALSGECTLSGQPIPGGTDIDALDAGLAAKLWPKAVLPPPPPGVSFRVPQAGTYTRTGD